MSAVPRSLAGGSHSDSGTAAAVIAWLDSSFARLRTPFSVTKGSAAAPLEMKGGGDQHTDGDGDGGHDHEDDDDGASSATGTAAAAGESQPQPQSQSPAAAVVPAQGRTLRPRRGAKRASASAGVAPSPSASASVSPCRAAVLARPLPFRVATLTADFELTRYSHLHTRVKYDLDDLGHCTGASHSAAATTAATAPEELARAVAAGFVTVTLPLPDSPCAPSAQSQDQLSASAPGHALSVGQLLDACASFYSSLMTPLEMEFLRACIVNGTLDRGDAEQRYLLPDAPPAAAQGNTWPTFDFSKGGWSDEIVSSALRKLGLPLDGDSFDRAFRYFVDDKVLAAFSADPSVFAVRSRVSAELSAEAEAGGRALSDAFHVECDWPDAAVSALARALWQRPLEGAVRPALLDDPQGKWFLRFAPEFPGGGVGALLLIGLYRQAARAHPEIADEIEAIVERVRAELSSDCGDSSSTERSSKKARQNKGKTKGKAKASESAVAIPAAAASSVSASSAVPAEKPPCVRRLLLGGRDRLFEIDVVSAERVESAGATPVTAAAAANIDPSVISSDRDRHQPIHLHLAFAIGT